MFSYESERDFPYTPTRTFKNDNPDHRGYHSRAFSRFMGILRPQIIPFAEQSHYNSLPRLKEIMENQPREFSEKLPALRPGVNI